MEGFIKSTDKILIVASKPDFISIACGGFISKYNKQIDLLYLDLSNINYPNKPLSNSNLDDLYKEIFIRISQIAEVNNIFFEKFSENTINDIEIFEDESNSQYNLKDYDVILIPQKDDNLPENQYVGNVLFKEILKNQGYKDNLNILRYEVWSPLKEADYYEDITSFVDKKKLLISKSKSEAKDFPERVLNMNKFRTFTSYLNGQAEYVEAYKLEDLNAYMQIPDIINEETEKSYKNEHLEQYFKNADIQTIINNLAIEYKNKEIIIYGAADFSRYIFKNYDLSQLNIIAIADSRFEQERKHEFYGLKCISPNLLKSMKFDVILIADNEFVKSYFMLKNILKVTSSSNVKIKPFIKKELHLFRSGENENKVCVRPFHTLSILPGGHCITCCPAYIKNYTIGNILENKFQEVWNSGEAKLLRELLSDNDYSICDMNTCIQAEFIDKSELSKYYAEESDFIKDPDTIYMGWDYDCNVACITCRNKIIKNSEETLNALQNIESGVLDACKNAKLFYTSGNGDPFGSSYARNLIKKVVEINPDIKFHIHTNGVLCSKSICEELNIKDKITNVIFSIHSACQETYDKIVRFGNFERVLKNAEWISELKKQGQVKSFVLAFVVHKINYKDMPNFVRIAERLDALASFRYYRQWANNTEYKYDDMAVFEKYHKEYPELVSVLQDKIFDSPNCKLDPKLQSIRDENI